MSIGRTGRRLRFLTLPALGRRGLNDQFQHHLPGGFNTCACVFRFRPRQGGYTTPTESSQTQELFLHHRERSATSAAFLRGVSSGIQASGRTFQEPPASRPGTSTGFNTCATFLGHGCMTFYGDGLVSSFLVIKRTGWICAGSSAGWLGELAEHLRAPADGGAILQTLPCFGSSQIGFSALFPGFVKVASRVVGTVTECARAYQLDITTN